MRNVLVSFEVSVTQSTDGIFTTLKPDYVFEGNFDKDDDKSHISEKDLSYKVEQLAKNLKSLGCRVVVLRKEVSQLNID